MNSKWRNTGFAFGLILIWATFPSSTSAGVPRDASIRLHPGRMEANRAMKPTPGVVWSINEALLLSSTKPEPLAYAFRGKPGGMPGGSMAPSGNAAPSVRGRPDVQTPNQRLPSARQKELRDDAWRHPGRPSTPGVMEFYQQHQRRRP